MFTTAQIQEATLANGRLMIQVNLRESDQWLTRGILAIYARQTADEQRAEATKNHNNIGFNGADARFLSSIAKQLELFNRNEKSGRPNKYREPMSPRQKQRARTMMQKYAGQLMRIVREAQPA
jgi:hypothetical protein